MNIRAQELGDSRGGGRPGLPVPNSPDILCRFRATFEEDEAAYAQSSGALSRGGRPGLPVP